MTNSHHDEAVHSNARGGVDQAFTPGATDDGRREGCNCANRRARAAEHEPVRHSAVPPHDAMQDVATMSLIELVDNIEATHHAYLRRELPRLVEMVGRVASRHGGTDPRLNQVCQTLLGFSAELSSHMWKEEQILFPMIRQLDASDHVPQFHCGSLANPMRQMETEHSDADAALLQMRDLTDGFTPPEWACATYRETLSALSVLEQDMHVHIHKENDVLFLRALELEAQKQHGAPVV